LFCANRLGAVHSSTSASRFLLKVIALVYCHKSIEI
jgi:hypothetical protein